MTSFAWAFVSNARGRSALNSRGTTFEDAFRPDLIINKTVIGEVKAARALDPVFECQRLTYLKIMNLRLGLLMNIGMATMKAGIRRIAN